MNYRKTRSILEDLKVEVQARQDKEAELLKVTMAVEQAGEVIVITDPAGTIQYANPAFETVTGYSRKEVLGQNLRIFKSGDQDETFYRDLWDSITRGQTWKGRMVNKRKDGRRYTEEATISPVLDAADQIINYVAVKRNITEQLELTAQIQQAQKMESVGRLAGGVAHDYNNMLSIIIGYAQLAMDKVGATDPLYAPLREIDRAAQRSTEITRKLLESLNYTVLGASLPDEALHLAEEHTGKICLLLTDVVMPEMNGRELADRLSARDPDMKLLFMSGYTADVIASQGILDKGMHFIQKNR
jgi:PAS domain S-box-containing protein